MAEDKHTWSGDDGATKRGSGANLNPDDLFALIGNDEVILRKVRLLINMILHNAFRTMTEGTMAEKTALSRALMPSIVKMVAQKDDGGTAALRAEFMKMIEEMGGGGEDPSAVASP